MGKSDKTKDQGIVGDRATNEDIGSRDIHAEQACCADGACCWGEKSSKRSVEDKGI